MKWLLIIFFVILFLLLFLIWFRQKRIFKRLTKSGNYSISGVPGSGKSAFAVCLIQSYKKGRVLSPFPMIHRDNKVYQFSFLDILEFSKFGSDYAFRENDLLIVDEIALFINSNDLGKEYKFYQESLGLFGKMIRHLFNGSAFFIEQHPNRLPIQLREKIEWFILVKEMRVYGFLLRFELFLYSNLDDYNKVVYSKRQTKKLIKKGVVPPSYSGEAYKMVYYSKKSNLKKYDTRVLSFVGDIKLHDSKIKSYKRFKKIKMEADDIVASGLEKIKTINPEKEKEND